MGGEHDYVFLVSHRRKRIRRFVSYYFRELLSYLTPLEAGYALSAFLPEMAAYAGTAATLLFTTPATFSRVAWCVGHDEGVGDLASFALKCLPQVSTFKLPFATALECQESEYALVLSAGLSNSVTVRVNSSPEEIVLTPLREGKTLSPQTLADSAVQRIRMLLSDRDDIAFESIEFGHMHLDRQPDIDQYTGIVIGQAISEHIHTSSSPIKIFPMIDDDHVLIHFTPAQYRSLLLDHGCESTRYHLVPESSPIVRAIVVALVACRSEFVTTNAA
jgi:hypothetical protein